MNFNPLPPHGGRPFHSCSFLSAFQFQSTPSAWRETRFFTVFTTLFKISIHSLRMEGDGDVRKVRHRVRGFQSTPSAWRETCSSDNRRTDTRISIHSLRMEGDLLCVPQLSRPFKFQSTPSAWRETVMLLLSRASPGNFNPLPPHGGRRFFHLHRQRHLSFQSTPSAWRETCCIGSGLADSLCKFQSTPSAWRETAQEYHKIR